MRGRIYAKTRIRMRAKESGKNWMWDFHTSILSRTSSSDPDAEFKGEDSSVEAVGVEPAGEDVLSACRVRGNLCKCIESGECN